LKKSTKKLLSLARRGWFPPVSTAPPEKDKSFLLLFLKKEVLSLLPIVAVKKPLQIGSGAWGNSMTRLLAVHATRS
jgi:hypothetical protein